MKYTHEGFCWSLAKRFSSEYDEQEELAAVARESLMSAEASYDPAGGPFWTYARPLAYLRVLDAWADSKRAGICTKQPLARVRMVDREYTPDGDDPYPEDFWHRIFSVLPYKQMQVVYMIYRLGLSERVIAEVLGISRSAVGQLKQRAFSRIRSAYPAMEDYLG